MNELRDQLYMLGHEGYSPNVEDIEQTLAQLPLVERSSMLLAVEGFTPEEIADMLDIDVERSIEAVHSGREEFLRIYSTLISEHHGNEALVAHDPEFVDMLIRSLSDAEASSGSELPFSLQGEDDKREQERGSVEDASVIIEWRDGEESQQALSENDLAAFFSSEAPEPKTSPLCLLDRWYKQRIGSYCLQGILGTGKTGTVYQALHGLLGTSAAVKVLNVRLADESVAQFYKEASLLTWLEHPHIVRVFDYGIEDGRPYFVMDYAPGGSVRKRYPKGTRLPLTTVVDYTRQVSDALHYVHNRGLEHRDVKPENLLLGADDRLLLADFGIATVIPRKYTMTSATHWKLWSSIEYIAPEQFSGESSPASDQYALGVVVYEWLAGMPVSGGKAADQPGVVYTPLKQVVPELPPDIDQVVSRALQQEPALRYQSVLDFAADLERACKPKEPPVGSLEQRGSIGLQPRSRGMVKARRRLIYRAGLAKVGKVLRGTLANCVVAVLVGGLLLALLSQAFGENSFLLLISFVSLLSLASIPITIAVCVWKLCEVMDADRRPLPRGEPAYSDERYDIKEHQRTIFG